MAFLGRWCAALALGWLGVNSFFVGLAYWGHARGAFLPLAAGAALMWLAARQIIAVARFYGEKPEG